MWYCGTENDLYCAEAADRSYGPLTIQELGIFCELKRTPLI